MAPKPKRGRPKKPLPPGKYGPLFAGAPPTVVGGAGDPSPSGSPAQKIARAVEAGQQGEEATAAADNDEVPKPGNEEPPGTAGEQPQVRVCAWVWTSVTDTGAHTLRSTVNAL